MCCDIEWEITRQSVDITRTSVTEVKHRTLRIVLGWGTKVVEQILHEVE